MMERKEIDNIVESMALTHSDFSEYLNPTDVEVKKMRTCGVCEFNKPFTLVDGEGNKTHTRFCHKNFHYVKNNSIQLTCWLNKQHLLENNWRNRLILWWRNIKKSWTIQ